MKIIIYLFKILKHFFYGEFSLGFYNLSKKIPKSIFYYNKATLLYTQDIKLNKINDSSIKIKIADISDIEHIHLVNSGDKDHIQQMLNSGAVCFLASLDNEYCTVGWAAFDKCYIRGLGYTLDFDHEFHYTFGLFTLPETRKKGLNLMLLSASFNLASQKNINNYYSIVEFTNDYALAFHDKLGFESIAKITYLKLFCLKICKVKEISSNKNSYRFFIREPKENIIVV